MKDRIIAFCYLQSANNEKNRCNLWERYLEVIYKDKSHIFPLDAFTGITFSLKKIWLPLVFGGLLASLSAVALFKELTNPWYTFISMLTGLLLFYYGHQGTQVMTVLSGADQTHFFIGRLTPNLESFRNFVLDYRFDRDSKSIYLLLPNDAFQEGVDLMPGNFGWNTFRCLTKSQSRNIEINSSKVMLEIDPLKVDAEIKFEFQPDTPQLVPIIYGKIPAKAIISQLYG